mmetsp:Transcript_20332/g.44437  ORF Transcript_20332/g.44437 Transcript_20332/m.44437 type:complete len:627 (+) Transcript_20332:169-2049(+)|eukprot:CAMPEP_0202890248 /NCGR_PEP_ID=MMETSP1392-20130828/728_1 /ASSEMBLY_ACC=CAM_ASM_000868 /TAXON_ID=225041 /ORGANISM="Chlamydomonas chlamydogama, Strain SAG 11-48b" /LENGTH=626 /DNA_ID=CAMNT_0049573785 /DNA_START=164 /DNA_END=2044 /DNA_ORIENTATION=+
MRVFAPTRKGCAAALLVLLLSAPYASAQTQDATLDLDMKLSVDRVNDDGSPYSDFPKDAIPNDPPTELKGPIDAVPEYEKVAPGPIVIGPIGVKGLVFNNVGPSWSPTQQWCVRVNQAPVDVYFLADTTGSMGGQIKAIQTAASTMHASLTGTLTNLNLGVGGYKDFGDTYVFQNFQPIASLTATQFQTATNNWVAGGGGDWPEANLYALHQVATVPSINWRGSSIRVAVWFGDAPGHDPSGGVSLALAQASLTAAGIRVIALDCAALNSGGQATTLATATGGQYYASVSSASIAATMVTSLVGSVAITIKPVVTCPANTPVVIEFIPPTVTSTPLKPGCFQVRVKACAEGECVKPATYTCTVSFVDVSNNQVISTAPITINTAGTDTTPPVFSPAIPPVSYLVECPNKYVFPELTAVDNCDGPVPVKKKCTSSGPPGGGCINGYTETCTWTAVDSAGNVASVTQSVTYQDSTPPFIKPACKKAVLCLNETGDYGTLCINTAKYKKCFDDSCSDVKDVTITCGSCTTFPPSTPFSFQCSPGSNPDELCFTFKGPVREKPWCCDLKAVVTDACGNTASYPFPKICVFSPYTMAPPVQQCTGGIFPIGPPPSSDGGPGSNNGKGGGKA